MKMLRSISILLAGIALATLSAFGAQPKAVMKDSSATNLITENLSFGSGKSESFLSGSTLSLGGAVSGTPTGGTLNLAALTLTLPSTVSGGTTSFQPRSSELDADAAITGAAFGRALKSEASAATARSTLALDNTSAHGATGSTEAIDAAYAWHSLTLDANCTVTLSGWPASGNSRTIVLEILQDGTGGRSITWPAAVLSAPTLDTTANAVTLVSLSTRDGGTTVFAQSTAEDGGSVGGSAINLPREAWVTSSGNDGDGTIGDPARPYATIDAALDDLATAGGVIHIGIGTFASPTSAKIRSRYSFIGSGRPITDSTYSVSGYIGYTTSAPTQLVGGTILQGSFDVPPTVSHISVESLGIDVGSLVCTALYSGAARGALNMGADNAHPAQTSTPPRPGMRIFNVAVLCKDAASTDAHACILENCLTPTVTSLYTYYGFAGLVMKTIGGVAKDIHTHGHDYFGIIIKGNMYAYSYGTILDGFECRSIGDHDSGGVYLDGHEADTGLNMAVTISNGNCLNTKYAINMENYRNDSCSISNVTAVGCSQTAFNILGLWTKVTNCIARGNQSHGFVVAPDAAVGTTISDCSALQNGGDGFRFTGSVRVDFNNLISVLNTGYGINVTGSNVYGGKRALDSNTAGAVSGTIIDASSSSGPSSFTTLTDGATITWAADTSFAQQNAKVTLGGNRALSITGATNGMHFTLLPTQDGTGSRTLTLPAGSYVAGGGGGAVTLSTVAGRVDKLSGVYNGTSFYWDAPILNFTAGDTTPPTLSSATVDTTTLTLVWSEAATRGGSYSNSHLDLDASTGGSNRTLTYVSGDGTTTWVFTVGTTIVNGETCDLDFSGASTSIVDGAGNSVAAIVSASVTNTTGSGPSSPPLADDFNASTQDPIGDPYELLVGSSFKRESGELRVNSGDLLRVKTTSYTFNTNQYAQALPGGSGGQADLERFRIALRVQSDGSGYHLAYNSSFGGGVFQILKRTWNGSSFDEVQVGSNISFGGYSGGIVGIRVTGSAIQAYSGDYSTGGHSDVGSAQTDSSSPLSGGTPGFRYVDSLGAVNSWKAGNY